MNITKKQVSGGAKLQDSIRAGCPIALAKRAICSCSSVYFLSAIEYLLFVVRKTTNKIIILQILSEF